VYAGHNPEDVSRKIYTNMILKKVRRTIGAGKPIQI
jgi:hypothetical protein